MEERNSHEKKDGLDARKCFGRLDDHFPDFLYQRESFSNGKGFTGNSFVRDGGQGQITSRPDQRLYRGPDKQGTPFPGREG
jgi:hypothetical protein